MTLLLVILLVILALLGGFAFGIWSTACTIEKHYKTAWKHLVLEVKLNKRKRADAAREKEE